LACSVQTPPALVKTTAAPAFVPLEKSAGTPAIIVSASIATEVPNFLPCAESLAVSLAEADPVTKANTGTGVRVGVGSGVAVGSGIAVSSGVVAVAVAVGAVVCVGLGVDLGVAVGWVKRVGSSVSARIIRYPRRCSGLWPWPGPRCG
jgi:hypothetical protein